MLSENFVYFFTVWGFFVGLIFSILKSFNAEGLLTYTLSITAFFYLFSHLIIAFYYKTMSVKTYLFPKDVHEKNLDMYVTEIKKKEAIIDNAISLTTSLMDLNSHDNENDKNAK